MTDLRGTVFSRSLLWLFVLVMGVALPVAAHAQTSVYLDYGATMMKTDGQTISRVLYGPAGGVVFTVRSGHAVDLGADIRGFYTQESGANAAILGGMLLGPKLTTHIKRVKPYGEFLMGFARYKNGSSTFPVNTTDTEVELNAGLDLQLKKHLDWRVFEYSWAKYLASGGEFNPRGYSTGVVYNF